MKPRHHLWVLVAVLTLIATWSSAATTAGSAPLFQEHGVLYVRAQIDDTGPLLFTFDPGGQDVYTSYARTRLNGRAPKVVCLGNACFPAGTQYLGGDPNELDPKHDPKDGMIAGSIGPALLSHYIARIDYRASTLTLIPVSTFRPVVGASRLPLTFDKYGMPVAQAAVDGVTAPFEIDLRAPSSLLFPPFMARTGARTVRDVRIGGFELDAMPFKLSSASSGKFASAEVAGLLGNNILSHFVLTLDFPHKSMYLSR